MADSQSSSAARGTSNLRTSDGPTGSWPVRSQLYGKSPTRAVEERHQVAATRTERRLFAQVDFRGEMRRIASVNPAAFPVTNPARSPGAGLLDNVASR